MMHCRHGVGLPGRGTMGGPHWDSGGGTGFPASVNLVGLHLRHSDTITSVCMLLFTESVPIRSHDKQKV